MPDLETELVRFGRWLDREIADRVAEPSAGAAATTDAPHRAARDRRRLVAAVGIAAAIAAGLLAVTARRPPPALVPPAVDGPGTTAAASTDPPRAVTTATPSVSAVVGATSTPDGAAASAVYLVRQGDTLAGIAARLGVTDHDLIAANPEIDPAAFLIVGQRLRVPAASAIATATSAADGSLPYALPADRSGFVVSVSPIDASSLLANRVLVGRRAAAGSWRDLARVQALPSSAADAAPTASGFDGTGSCDCVVGIERGVQVIVEGATDRAVALALYERVVVADGTAITFAGGLPDGFEEIARTPAGAAGTTSSLVSGSDVVTIETWVARPGEVVADIPVRPAGELTRIGDTWRFHSSESDVTVRSVVPGTATKIVVPAALAARRDALVDELRPVSRETWTQLALGASGTYTVVAGDTVESMLAKLGITLEMFLRANPRFSPSVPLVPGRRYSVPPG